jgi:hypothetical protein
VARRLKCTRRRAFAVLASSIVGLALLSSCNPIGKLLYKGDGTFSDRSEFSRPRYIIRFNKIPAFQIGTYQFHFRGLPNEKMTLVLYVEGEPPRQDEDLRALKTVIEAALINNQGDDVANPRDCPR